MVQLGLQYLRRPCCRGDAEAGLWLGGHRLRLYGHVTAHGLSGMYSRGRPLSKSRSSR